LKKIYLTFDIDWAIDEIIEDSIDLILEYGARATFFITHGTPILKTLRQFPQVFELGIHPNFNKLLKEGNKGHGMDSIVKDLKKIVPEAISARSHSMTQSSLIWDIFRDNGIKYDVNTLIPAHTKISLRSFYTINGIIRVPYCWEDDDHLGYGFMWGPDCVLENKGIKVFDFHPIHVFLNTEKMKRYEKSRIYMRDFSNLRKVVNKRTGGVRDFLIKLLRNKNNSYGLIGEIQPEK